MVFVQSVRVLRVEERSERRVEEIIRSRLPFDLATSAIVSLTSALEPRKKCWVNVSFI